MAWGTLLLAPQSLPVTEKRRYQDL